MDKKAILEELKKLIAAGSVCPEAKKAGEDYLASIGTAEEKKAAEALIKELKEDVTSIDGLIAFASSPDGEKAFGKDTAEAVRKQAEEAKAKGEKICICEACRAAAVLLENQDLLLKL